MMRRLNIADLERSEIAYDYYRRHYNFMYASHADGKFKNIPLLEKTSHYLSDHAIKLPNEYIDGFINEYNKPLKEIKTDTDRQYLLRHIQPNPIIFQKDLFELGCKTADAFKAWEYIINDLPRFEKYFTGKFESGKEKIPVKFIIKGIAIDKLTTHLVSNDFFDNKDSAIFKAWLIGKMPKNKIEINKPMNHFCSIIADLQESRFIKNSKVFCYTLIFKSFTFKGKSVSIESIKNVFKPGHKNRLQTVDVNFIDIQRFKLIK